MTQIREINLISEHVELLPEVSELIKTLLQLKHRSIKVNISGEGLVMLGPS